MKATVDSVSCCVLSAGILVVYKQVRQLTIHSTIQNLQWPLKPVRYIQKWPKYDHLLTTFNLQYQKEFNLTKPTTYHTTIAVDSKTKCTTVKTSIVTIFYQLDKPSPTSTFWLTHKKWWAQCLCTTCESTDTNTIFYKFYVF